MSKGTLSGVAAHSNKNKQAEYKVMLFKLRYFKMATVTIRALIKLHP